MAQDVHDGVGHSLAVIAMQAGVAAHVLDRDPAGPASCWRRPRRPAGRRSTGCAPTWSGCAGRPTAPPAGPAPGLADLPMLLDRMRDGGLP